MAPLAPTGLSVNGKKIKGKQSAQLTWTAAQDVDPGSGIARYDVYRNGVYLGSTTSLKYTDSTVAQDVATTYAVTAVDQAGHVSPASAEAVHTPGGGPGGGNNGGGGGNGRGKKTS